jgi:undecaprenyl-diphosphatase
MIIEWDAAILSALQDWRGAYPDSFFASVTWFGSLWLLLPLSLVLVAGMVRCGRCSLAVRQMLYLPAALACTSLITFALKAIFDRSRPSLFRALAALPADASFPSAHTAQITAFCLAGWLLMPRPERIWSAPLLVMLVMAVAVSRLYLQVHWPSDVVAGIFVGVACTIVLRRFLFH